MKNIQFIRLFILMLGGCLFFSCDEFLEEDPNEFTTEANLSSREVAEAYVNSAYTELPVLAQTSSGWGGTTLGMLAFMTGKATGVPQTEAFRFNELRIDDNAFYINDYWRRLYRGIQNTNLAIEKLPDFEVIGEQERNEMIAQVRTMRAFYYFTLVRIFGDVPKITEVIASLNEVSTPRSPVKEIYDEIIIPDLLFAESTTLPPSDNSGKVSMGMVKTLLADVYLTYAGFPVQAGNQFYAEAATRAREVVESGAYSLFTNFSELRDPAMENSGEIIFQVQFDKANSSNPLTPRCLPLGLDISAAYDDEHGGIVPHPDFVASYPEGDLRAENGNYYIYRYTPAFPDAEERELGGPYIHKYYDQVAVDEDARSEVNFTVYRLPEPMLIYAEAINRANGGPDAQALDYVNAVRSRAGLDPVAATSQDEFEQIVWTERYLELSFEGKIWYDMVRTRQVRNDITGEFENYVGHTNLYGGTYEERHLLMPIPGRELDNNSALTQNPGY